jgi:hypothetical protein
MQALIATDATRTMKDSPQETQVINLASLKETVSEKDCWEPLQAAT